MTKQASPGNRRHNHDKSSRERSDEGPCTVNQGAHDNTRAHGESQIDSADKGEGRREGRRQCGNASPAPENHRRREKSGALTTADARMVVHTMGTRRTDGSAHGATAATATRTTDFMAQTGGFA